MVSSPEQVRLALKEVLASETFARSDQLRSFLRYVCEKSLAGQGREINEYSVAVEALGKPQDFSPAEDSSVRTRAYELRQKLQKYYDIERPNAPIRIELPKGSYTPRFAEWTPAPVPPSRDRTVRLLAAGLVVAVLVAVACAILAVRNSRLRGVDPVVKEAWGPLARPGAEVLVSVGTTLHLVVRPYMTVVAEGLPKYPAPPELYPLFRQHRPLPDGVELDMHPVDNSVQLGHMASVVNGCWGSMERKTGLRSREFCRSARASDFVQRHSGQTLLKTKSCPRPPKQRYFEVTQEKSSNETATLWPKFPQPLSCT